MLLFTIKVLLKTTIIPRLLNLNDSISIPKDKIKYGISLKKNIAYRY